MEIAVGKQSGAQDEAGNLETCHEGYFTNHRAAMMGVREATCAWCNSTSETVNHMLWGCSWLRTRRLEIQERIQIEVADDDEGDRALCSIIKRTLAKSKYSVAGMEIVSEWIQSVWHERNKYIFEGKQTLTPLMLIMGRALRSVCARLESGKGGEERDRILQKSIDEIVLGMGEGRGNCSREEEERRECSQSSGNYSLSNEHVRRSTPARSVGSTVDRVTRGSHPGRPPDRY
ncbi:hypothetical protein R1flu_011809 [Riccia fluitans]|uniref:Reverse transcriptase n=1 Tax=Riccia fluitans TaxID=41844 RepID=A0ABD1ZD09_9MARC